MTAPQHAGLTAERWSAFSKDQQILMIANEMNRAGKLFGADDGGRRRGCYERALRLTDLTVQVQRHPGLRRELLRWRDLIATLYIAAEPSPDAHLAAFRALLRLTPAASAQIPAVPGLEAAPPGVR